MNKREAGALGGRATFAKYGAAHMSMIGIRVTEALAERVMLAR